MQGFYEKQASSESELYVVGRGVNKHIKQCDNEMERGDT